MVGNPQHYSFIPSIPSFYRHARGIALETKRNIVQTTIDGSSLYNSYVDYKNISVEDIRILAELYEDQEDKVKLSPLQIAILFGVLPTNPAIYGSRKNEEVEGIGWTLPGRGERSRWDGKWLSKDKVDVCPNCGKVQHYKHHCDKLTCPSCCWDALSKRSTNATERIMKGRDLFHPESGDPDRSLQHIVISAPKNEWFKAYSEEGYADLRKRAINIASEIGLIGGVVVFHPFRRNGIDDDKIEEGYISDEENNMNPLFWREGPHFHFLGYGFVQQCTSEWIGQHKGWLFKSLRTGKDKITTKAQLYATVRYIVSHVGIMEGSDSRKQTMSYFGELNSKNLNEKAHLEAFRPKKCECGGTCHCYEVNMIEHTVEDKGLSIDKRVYPIFGKASDREVLQDTIIHYKRTDNALGLIRESEIGLSRSMISSISSNLLKDMINDGWMVRIVPNFKVRKKATT